MRYFIYHKKDAIVAQVELNGSTLEVTRPCHLALELNLEAISHSSTLSIKL